MLAGDDFPASGEINFTFANADIQVVGLVETTLGLNFSEDSSREDTNLNTDEFFEDTINSPSVSNAQLSPEDSLRDDDNFETEDLFGDPILSPSASHQDVQNKKVRKKRVPQPNETTPVKKRALDPSRWKAAKAKLAHNSGAAHISLRGKSVEARSMGGGCPPTCRRNCHANITHEQRLRIFQTFWALKDHTRQWDFIVRHVKRVEIRQRRDPTEDKADAFRKHSYIYNLYNPDNISETISVCQTMFLATLSVSVTYVKTAFIRLDKSEGKISPIKMGKIKKKTPASVALDNSVVEHIKSYPTVESHYCRERTKRQYLDEHLSVSRMYRMYIIKRGNKQRNATLAQYREIFNTKFNLSFFKPKKDQCPDCLAWNNMTESEKAKAEAVKKYSDHIQDKKKVKLLKEDDLTASKAKNEAEGSSTVRVITFDLEKVLYCPKGENSDFFYKRKLSNYNFTVFDCITKEAVCYCWDQLTAGRGADEICSCLLHYIGVKVEEGVIEFHFYSDNCSAQNKNQFLFSLYCWLCLKYGIKIVHRWLVKGHTHMECDSVHAMVEKRTKNVEIFTPSQWFGLIRAAKVNPPMYKVVEVDQSMVFNFERLGEMHLWARNVPILSLKELSLSSEIPGVATYKTEYDGAPKTFRVLPQAVGRPINWKTFQLPCAYSGVIPLPPKLYEDLMWYVKKGHIPTAYLYFYNSLPKPVPVPPTTQEAAQLEDVPQVLQVASQVPQHRRAVQAAKGKQPASLPAKRKETVQSSRVGQQSKRRKKKNQPETINSDEDDPDPHNV